jgi:transcriptional regulator with XRE-family HTH domain
MARLVIKEIAERKGLNRSQLQIKAGVTLPMLNRYWNNDTDSVHLASMEKIARALGVRVSDLFAEDDASKEVEVAK